MDKGIEALRTAAESAGSDEWMHSYIPPFGKHFIVSRDGSTIINLSEGDVPAKCVNFIVEACPAYILKLIAALEQAQRQNGYLREQSAEWERKAISNFEESSEMFVRIEELESQRKLAFMACNRWRDKCADAEKRIAELESRQLSVKLPAGTNINGFQMLIESEVVAYLREEGINAEVFRAAGGIVEGGE